MRPGVNFTAAPKDCPSVKKTQTMKIVKGILLRNKTDRTKIYFKRAFPVSRSPLKANLTWVWASAETSGLKRLFNGCQTGSTGVSPNAIYFLIFRPGRAVRKWQGWSEAEPLVWQEKKWS
jgi:hypothetical protein